MPKRPDSITKRNPRKHSIQNPLTGRFIPETQLIGKVRGTGGHFTGAVATVKGKNILLPSGREVPLKTTLKMMSRVGPLHFTALRLNTTDRAALKAMPLVGTLLDAQSKGRSIIRAPGKKMEG